VPDTIDGRFGMIVVHLFLLEHRIIEGGLGPYVASSLTPAASGSREVLRMPAQTTEYQAFAQFLSEAFFNDMDSSLREFGVGDTGVSHRIKKMGKAYHGCLQAYAAGTHDPQLLRSALARNLYGTVENGDVTMLDRMAHYIEKMHTILAATDMTTITSGHYAWPDAATLGV
jgi:cytochrome b pre-mRNA-processing protein 3